MTSFKLKRPPLNLSYLSTCTKQKVRDTTIPTIFTHRKRTRFPSITQTCLSDTQQRRLSSSSPISSWISSTRILSQNIHSRVIQAGHQPIIEQMRTMTVRLHVILARLVVPPRNCIRKWDLAPRLQRALAALFGVERFQTLCLLPQGDGTGNRFQPKSGFRGGFRG